MIATVKLSAIASYSEDVSFQPNHINYFYGSNGSGKTTLSKFIASSDKFPNCTLSWNKDPIDTLVYNKSFVQENFGLDSNIKGIFTLGKASKEVMTEIERIKDDLDTKKYQLEGLRNSYSEKKSELENLRSGIEEHCWKTKKKYEKTFPELWKGYSQKKTFLEKCISESDSQLDVLPVDELITQYKKLVQTELKLHSPISNLDFNQLAPYESSELLQKSVVGKESVDVGELVKKLGKDAVTSYLPEEENCPFCLQELPAKFKETIESFFDETYERECHDFRAFAQNYINYLNTKLEDLRRIVSIQSGLINFHELELKIETVAQKIDSIIHLVESKKNSPSEKITPLSLVDDFCEVEKLLTSYREEISQNNATVNNLGKEQNHLKSLIWRFLSNEVASEISTYEKKKKGNEAALLSLENQGKKKNQECKDLENQLKKKESEVTSVTHTVNEINKTLTLLDFHNFSLAEAGEKGMYKIVRECGSDCRDTLSEGEYNFVTFLYFYQLLKGSIEESGLTRDKIVVIDDPISSLDSSVLFMVSNLVKDVVKDCLSNKNGISQVFILTHNIYFHKEVTFKGNRDGVSNRETFWVVKKVNKKSSISKFEENPIKTTYELLWRELDDVEKVNKATIHNTLRRILEYYFNIIGGMNYEKCINEFEGEEKQICKTLVSWINDGSHFINDDLVIDSEPDIVEKYVNVFEMIFEKLGHENHYNMMMRKQCS